MLLCAHGPLPTNPPKPRTAKSCPTHRSHYATASASIAMPLPTHKTSSVLRILPEAVLLTWNTTNAITLNKPQNKSGQTPVISAGREYGGNAGLALQCAQHKKSVRTGRAR
ncbi:MAG: hypothetical protein ACXVA2_04665 [Mucilaginibacter sp.]